MPWTQDINALKKSINRRLLVLYVVLFAVLLVTVGSFQYIAGQREEARRAFQQQITGVCYTTRENTLNLNSAVDQLIQSVKTSKILTPTEKAERVAFYIKIRGEVPQCPPR